MLTINSEINRVEVGKIAESSFNQLLETVYSLSRKIIIVDENTEKHCLPIIKGMFDSLLNAEIIVIPAGETFKTLEVCQQVWEAFSEYQIQRRDLVINLGGGMITDLGGFIASIYQRGIDFINIPTSLLAMVDASVGGKTGINLGALKNQLGVFSQPVLTVCDAQFLFTLPERELRAGWAEMIKHGVIASRELVDELVIQTELIPQNELLAKSIQVKADIVDRDFKEAGERKKLNFGHTVGHSLESFLLSTQAPITHGEAVAWGMLVEAFLSVKLNYLSEEEFSILQNYITRNYSSLPIQTESFDELISLMHHDKKNYGEAINFTLLKGIGNAEINVLIDEKTIYEALGKL